MPPQAPLLSQAAAPELSERPSTHSDGQKDTLGLRQPHTVPRDHSSVCLHSSTGSGVRSFIPLGCKQGNAAPAAGEKCYWELKCCLSPDSSYPPQKNNNIKY